MSDDLNSHLGTFDPDKGDLGLPELTVNPDELYVAAPHVARCLEGAYALGLRSIRYAFMITVPSAIAYDRVNQQVRALAQEVNRCCPHVNFYETGGRRLFQIRSEGGGLRHGFYICYLVAV